MVLCNELIDKYDYPLLVSIYNEYTRLAIIPCLRHIGGYSIEDIHGVIVEDMNDYYSVGREVFKSLEYIAGSPRSRLTPKESDEQAVWRTMLGYKSWKDFWKNNLFIRVQYHEDGTFSVFSVKRGKTAMSVYGDCIKIIELPANATETDIGRAVYEVAIASKEYHDSLKGQNLYPPKDLTLLDKSRLTITPPKNSHFEDTGDMGAMECYQSYSYIPKEGDEASAIFYLTIAPEIDCDLSTDNVRACWEETYGDADFFEMNEEPIGIYTHHAIMKNKEQYRKSYYLQMEEDLILECGMTVYMPNRRKKLCEKMETLFEEFAAGCKFTS